MFSDPPADTAAVLAHSYPAGERSVASTISSFTAVTPTLAVAPLGAPAAKVAGVAV